ncbi:hypothetical protein DdX_14466 [Ditylenchus destructor]|uniref:Uncharacterized protein n=1 Tax=Ditylenchus destructor TaxID=166010 RepID=A0AAD4R1V5_9BILA|nr:hypothetical protein DdX_14466 [Ditylenchus destructor]
MKLPLFTFTLFSKAESAHANASPLEHYLKYKHQHHLSQAQISYVERLADCFNRFVALENDGVRLDSEELDFFIEDNEASHMLTGMFSSLEPIDQALEAGSEIDKFMKSMLDKYKNTVHTLPYDYPKKVMVQIVWWIEHETQPMLRGKLANLVEFKARGRLKTMHQSSHARRTMDNACVKGWGMWSAYHHKFDVDVPSHQKVLCYEAGGPRSEDELYNVDLLTTLFTEMVRIEGPNCAHVFSAFDEPDTNKKVMQVGEHVREIAEEAIKIFEIRRQRIFE